MKNPNQNFDFRLPYDYPFATQKVGGRVEEMLVQLYSHPYFKWRKRFNFVRSQGSKTLVQDMARTVVNAARYYVLHPEQFNHSFDNVQWQVLIRMWRCTYNHEMMQQQTDILYKKTSVKLLSIEVGLWDEVLRVVLAGEFNDRNTNRERKPITRPWQYDAAYIEGADEFEQLCGLD